MSVTLRAWLDAFSFTQLVEVPFYVLAMRHALRGVLADAPPASGPEAPKVPHPPRALRWQLLLAFGASAITHPFVWFVFPRLPASFADPGDAYLEYVVRAETFAFLVEAFYFYLLDVASLRRALAWSLLANGLSAGLGFASRHYFHWP